MRSILRVFKFAKPGSNLFAILVLLFSLPSGMGAQYAPVPPSFQPMYTELDNYLINFNATLLPGSVPAFPTLMAGSLKAADANDGPGLLNGSTTGTELSSSGGAQLQLNALKATGVQAVMVEVGFPMLYAPFLATQNATYQQQFTNYYQAVANAIRQAGLKVVVENDSLLVNDVAANWDVAPFYATLNWTQYQAARAQTALTIAQVMQPDYLVVLQEPQTEAANSGQANVNTVAGSVSMLTQLLASVQQSGVPGMLVGAGTGASQVNPPAMDFIPAFVTLPMDFIDIHIYPINDSFLPIAQEMAATAAAAGLSVGMSECWMWKVLDTELSILSPDQVRGRDPFSFWAPLDAYFIQTMQSLANNTQMLFLDVYGSQYFSVYQAYGPATENLTPTEILNQETQLVLASNTKGAGDDSTGISFYNSIIVPPDTTPPTAPTGLTGVSGNPTEASLNWNAATDNVGVVGYYVLRNGVNISTTGTLYYQDSGLTGGQIYSYAIEAFDLAENVSAPSKSIDVQTTNVTPPTTPGNVAVQAVACTKAVLTWSASTDTTGVTEYLVWMGLSVNVLTQVAVVGGSTTTYSNKTLSPATTYYFGVQAEDKNHNISYMSAIVSVTTPALPVAPYGVLPEADSTTEVSVTWSASTGGLPIAHYMVYRGFSASVLSQVATVDDTSYTDRSLTASTTYYYSIQAADSGQPPAQSGLSPPVSVTTYAPPSVPANLAATPISCTKVGLTWSAALSGGLPIGNYHVYKGSSPSNLTQLALTPNTSYTDTTDAAQTKYYYAIQSSDTAAPADLSAISAAVAVTTYAYPSAPANLTATPVSSSKITLSWSASTSGGLAIANYHVYGGTSPSSLSQIAVTLNTSYNDLALTAGTTYYYAVQAADTSNDYSAFSNTVSATTLQPPTSPTNVMALGTSNSEIAGPWSTSSGALPIAHYYVFSRTSPSNLSLIAATINLSYNDESFGAANHVLLQRAGDGHGWGPFARISRGAGLHLVGVAGWMLGESQRESIGTTRSRLSLSPIRSQTGLSLESKRGPNVAVAL